MKKTLSLKQTILIAGTLFGMFFGAGNLIFPVHLGQLAGSQYLITMVGFCITAVGIPILGVAAIGNTHSAGLRPLASKVSKKYGYVFTILLYLAIGPFFAIPRCATVSFTTGISGFVTEAHSVIAQLIYTTVFFAIVLVLSLKPRKITVWIGKIINPVFLVFLAILVITALVGSKTSAKFIEPESAYQTGAFFSSLIEGYGTMDAIAGLAFGIVVIDIVKAMGVKEDGQVAKEVLKSGVFAGLLMGIIYVATILMGAQSRSVFAISENGGIALTQLAEYYLGTFGRITLAVTIALACLKTSIGLVVSCADAFVEMFPKKLSYSVWVIIFTVFSLVVSNFGLTAIINYSIPALMFLYPLVITLILLALFGKLFKHDKIVYQFTTGFALFAAIFDFVKALPQGIIETLHLQGMIEFGRVILPWFDLNLGWVVPSAVGLSIGLLVRWILSRASQRKARFASLI